MSSKCCDCTTKYREFERKASCFMQKEGGPEYKPANPSTRSCRYSFKPHSTLSQAYTKFQNILITRRFDGITDQPCDCASLQGQEDTDGDINANPQYSDFGTIEKCTSGSWVLVAGDPATCGVHGDGQQCFKYKKTMKGTDSINDFKADHQCGKTCPGVPWNAGRKIDLQDKYAQECSNWN